MAEGSELPQFCGHRESDPSRVDVMDKKWWTLIVVCAGTFMLLLDVTIVVVALPEIQQGLHSTFSEVQWVIDAYALTLASVLLTAGSLADRYGRRLLFTIGLIVFTAGSLLCGLAQSPMMLILSRSAQGIGGAILFSTPWLCWPSPSTARSAAWPSGYGVRSPGWLRAWARCWAG